VLELNIVRTICLAAQGSYNGCDVPMVTRLRLSKRSLSPPVDATVYHSIVGSHGIYCILALTQVSMLAI
jgi:hypothetical protein